MSESTPKATASAHVLSPDGAAETRWSLTVLSSNGEQLPAVPVGEASLRIGRHLQSDFVISSPSVSKSHAEVVAVGPTVFVRDLGSTNGTFVNGRRIDSLEPLGHGDQIRIGQIIFQVQGDVLSAEETDGASTATEISLDSWLTDSLDEFVREGGLHMLFQPIVHTESQGIYGFEALLRTRIPGLESPNDLFRLASRMNMAAQLSHTCRMMAATEAQELPATSTLFLNSTFDERLDDELLNSLRTLRGAFPDLNVVVEIHEDCITNPNELRHFYDEVAQLDMRLAFDDFGSGNSRLQDLLHVCPAFVKFDRALIQNIHLRQGQEWTWVQSLVHSIHDLGVQAIAEGVESAATLEACRSLDFDLCQGYVAGEPGPASQWHQSRDRQRDTLQEMSTYSW